MKPAARSRARSAASTDSGLDSVVTSASAGQPEPLPIAATSRPRSAGGSRVGVPPPTKTVDTGGGVGTEHPDGQVELGDRGVDVAGAARARLGAQLGRGVGVEVAVAAAGGAERHMQVDAQRPLPDLGPGRRRQRAVRGRGLTLGQGRRHPAT